MADYESPWLSNENVNHGYPYINESLLQNYKTPTAASPYNISHGKNGGYPYLASLDPDFGSDDYFLKIGDKDAIAFYYGDVAIHKMYLGTALIYSA